MIPLGKLGTKVYKKMRIDILHLFGPRPHTAIRLHLKVIHEKRQNFLEMLEKSGMASDSASENSAIRVSVVRLVNTCTNLKLGNPLFRLENHLVKFPNGHLDRLPSFRLAITLHLLMKVV
jgi:hypothetical protein